jgi:3-carboxy-cis,cis-muconate cycloisomerase
LFSAVLERGRVRQVTSDTAWLAALIEVEVALGRASATAGFIPASHAEAIERAGSLLAPDIAELGLAAATTGTPVVALVGLLREAVGDDVAASVHRGATSQDIMDTAAMLIASRAIQAIVDDLGTAGDAAARLATEHATTVISGRTLLQRATPTTFGLKAAGWLAGLDRAIAVLTEVRDQRLAVQLGGGTGTRAAFDGNGRLIADQLATQLELASPELPWHAERSRIGELASALGVAAGVVAKVASDVVLLAQSEVAEVGEERSDRGGSSAMPHKRNPIAAVSAIASAQRAPGLVATLLGSMAHEHERAAGSWHAEWLPLRDLLVATGSASSWLRDCLEALVVRPGAIEANLAADRGLMLSERVVAVVTPLLGRSAALDLVAQASELSSAGSGFAAALVEVDAGRTGLDRASFEALLDPSTYLGDAVELTAAAVANHRRGRR